MSGARPPEGKRIRVLLADDHEVLLEALMSLLAEQADMEVVATAGTGRDALNLADQHRPDVVVMDIGMPQLNGIDATRRLMEEDPGVKVLCLSMHKDSHMVSSMLRAGAAGYLVKNCACRELVEGIRTVASGQTYLSPAIVGDILSEPAGRGSERRGGVYAQLSAREREILQLIAEGRSAKEIAADLGISDKTVAAHRLSLMEKLECQSVADLTRYAVRQGLIEP